MAVLTRQPYKVFSQTANGDQIAQFGSMKTGDPVYSTNIATLQGNSAYGQGWADAILEDKAPYLEEMNGLQYGASYQIGYLLQEGIPAYDATTNYSDTSLVKVLENNELQLFHSLQNDNIGRALDDTSWWTQVYFTNVGRIGQPQFTLDFANLPLNCVWLEGQTVSRTTYSNLFEIYGTAFGEGDGSTTFRLPNFRNRTIFGGESIGYISAGLPTFTGTAASAGAHTHTRGTMNITGHIAGLASQDKTADINANGAFSAYVSGGSGGYGTEKNNWYDAIEFDAKSSWTGSTSSAGAHTHTITIGGNSLIGKSTTVQPAAVTVRVYTRYQ